MADIFRGRIIDVTEKSYTIELTGEEIWAEGRVLVCSVEIRDRGDRIIVSELPYQVNKAQWITAIAEMVKDKRIDGITDIRDESDKDGIRVVFELRKGTMSAVILNQLYKLTALESSFWAINLAIVDNQPRVLNLHGLLENFVHHRIEVIRLGSEFDL